MTQQHLSKETATPARKKRFYSRPIFYRLLLVAGSVVLALMIMEVVLRVTGFTYFNPYIPDPDVGYSLRPNAEGWWTREGRTYVKINSRGFRDREHTPAKPPDTFRVAVLGDSFAEALQVPLEKTFWSVMERQLPGCSSNPKRKVEVLNFGVSGFSTARELVLLEKRVWQYAPDLVVLLVTTQNDVRDNSRRLTRYKNQPLPYFVFRDGQLVLDDSLVAERNRTRTFRLQNSFPGRAYQWLQSHSRVMGLVYTVREGALSPRSSPANEPGLDDEVYREPATPEWKEAWQLTEALMLRMRDEVRAKGASFLVVTGSSGIQVTPETQTRQAFMKQIGVDTLFYPDARVKQWGSADGFEVLNLAESLYEYAGRNQRFVQGSIESGGRGHWNELGHQLAGNLITEEICRKGF